MNIEFNLNIPSGHFVVGNDFRSSFPVHGMYDVNTTEGVQKTIKRYSDLGLGFLLVGKEKDILFWKKDFKTFYVGKKIKDKNPIPKIRTIFEVKCKLWWYSIADSELYFNNKASKNKGDFQEVICEPGQYSFIDYFLEEKINIHKHDYDLGGIYTEIKKISDPICKKYHNPYFELNISAEQVVDYYINNYKIKNISQIIGEILTNNQFYHPNGWMGNTPDITNNYSKTKIELNDPAYPIPFNLDSLIIQIISGGMNLNNSFKELAYNYFYSVLKYGYVEEPIDLSLTKDIMRQFIKKLE